VDRRPPDIDAARERLVSASAKLDEADATPFAEKERIASLRANITALSDRINSVLLDFSQFVSGAKLGDAGGNVNGLFLTDPGSGRLWLIFGDPLERAALLERGQKGVGSPVYLALQNGAVYTLDDAGKLWRREGEAVVDVTPADREKWKAPASIEVFTDNLYVLDAETGQLWKHESNDGVRFGQATAYLAAPLAPNTARSLAVDGDVWIVTSSGEVQRYRRSSTTPTAARVDFVPRWEGTAPRATAIQAVDIQRSIYVLDADGRILVQLNRDGRELARFALPPDLAPASGFYVSESLLVVYTLHGTKIAATSIAR
jgi:outer membrane protein assembly factor BamB